MKYLLFMIVALAVYIHFYPESETAKWLDTQKQNAIEAFADATDTKVRLSASKVYRDIEKEFNSFSSDERAYIEKVTDSRKSIVKFYNTHCGDTGIASTLHYNNQIKVCKIISKYTALF